MCYKMHNLCKYYPKKFSYSPLQIANPFAILGASVMVVFATTKLHRILDKATDA